MFRSSLSGVLIAIGVIGLLLVGAGLGFLLLKSRLESNRVAKAPAPMLQEQMRMRRSRDKQESASSGLSSAMESAIIEAMRPRDLSLTSTPVARAFCEESLRKMDWLSFERLVLELFRYLGFRAEKTSAGADGGVDIELHDPTAPKGALIKALIQCKARGSSDVGVDKARELFGVMAARKVPRGILICNTGFTSEAKAFARANTNLQLADLTWLMKQLEKVSGNERETWEKRFLGKDYDVPSCPSCEIKLVRRVGKQGEFWGCSNFPRGCRSKLPMRTEAKQDA